MDPKEVIISSSNLSIGYQKKPKDVLICKNISIAIEKGSFISVIGKNGIGKSTFLKTLTSELAVLNGDLKLLGRSISEYTPQELSVLISVVLTEDIPINQLTVYELVALGRQPFTNWIDSLSEEDHKVITQSLQETETYAFHQKKIYELSDGMKQRVLIARALAQDTPIMILDEPTVHLDLYHTITIFELLKALVKKHNKTVIISSHQLNLALKFSDQFLVMNDTEVFFGNKKQLLAKKAFDTLFPSDRVYFDKNLEQFVVK